MFHLRPPGQYSLSTHRQLKRLLQLTAAASLLASPSVAQESTRWSAGAGVFFGVSFSKTQPRFTWGLEAHGMRNFEEFTFSDCGSQAGVGPLLQLAYVSNRSWKMTTAVHGGWGSAHWGNTFLAEAGATYRFQQKDWGLRLGGLYEPAVLNVAVRHDFLIGDTFVGGGARMLSSFGAPMKCMVVDGRPLRTQVPFAFRGAKLSGWQKRAQEEYEAAFAFLNLAAELMNAGAPKALVERALGAARDEIHHASFCLREAKKRHPGFSVDAVREPFRALPAGEELLTTLAVEGVTDGIFGEGLAAQLMKQSAQRAHCPTVAHGLSQIFHEEKSHAQLGADIARWALDSDTSGAVRSSLSELRKWTPEFQATSPLLDPDEGFTSKKSQELAAERLLLQTRLSVAQMVG